MACKGRRAQQGRSAQLEEMPRALEYVCSEIVVDPNKNLLDMPHDMGKKHAPVHWSMVVCQMVVTHLNAPQS
jgi:hypothetical protein